MYGDSEQITVRVEAGFSLSNRQSSMSLQNRKSGKSEMHILVDLCDKGMICLLLWACCRKVCCISALVQVLGDREAWSSS